MAEFLLELFSEEIPARFQKQAADDLQKLFTDKLTAQGLSFTKAVAHVTPRRLTLVVDGLPVEQPAREEERKGPKIDAPQGAIDGFLKSAGLSSLDQCEQRDTPKGKVWVAISKIPGRKSADVLGSLIGDVLKEMPWKKSMNWSEGTFRWVRPLRSIIALFDGKVIPGTFELGGAESPLTFGDETQGHRFLSEGSIKVSNFADYVAKLRAAHVIIDREERKKIIKEGAEKALAAKGVTLKQDDGLLEEVCGLVEWPVPLVGEIDKQFMDIPAEVLVTTMRNNQKYFASVDSNGKMSPYFIVTANIPGVEGGKAIVEGNQRVLRARFSDAKFFWDVDRATKLAERVPQLASITFHAKLGTLLEKVERIEKLAVALNIPKADKAEVETAARLAKADLVSGMVGEFPELQGIMGGYYANNEKLGSAVATAITEHYSPLGPNDKCPSAPVSVAVALADKLDTLVGFFGIDEKPTGSKDPYALRRAALGILRLIIENKLRVDLSDMLAKAAAGYGSKLSVGAKTLGTELASFFADRLKVMLRDQGYRHDVIAAIFSASNMTDIVGQLGKLDELQKTLGSDDGKALLALYRRASNILKIEEKKDGKAYAPVANDNLLTEPQEVALGAALRKVTPDVQQALQAEKYVDAMQVMVSLRAPLDSFFEKVTVNAEKADIRANRLGLLAQVRETVNSVADLSLIEGE